MTTNTRYGNSSSIPNTLLQQQLHLHFGDKLEDVTSQAERFCKTVLRKPWWGSNRSVLLNNEGGLPGMVVQALFSIVEQSSNIRLGLSTYARYLRSEYGSDKLQYQKLGDEVRLYTPLTGEEMAAPPNSLSGELAASLPARKDLQPLNGLLHKILKTEEEQEFFYTFAHIGNVRETAQLLGMTYSHGMALWNRVHTRSVRQVQRLESE